MENELLRVALKHAHAIDEINAALFDWEHGAFDEVELIDKIDKILKRLKVKVGLFSVDEKVAALRAL